ncbi:MAG: BMP family ABC transporter substrate-binding protein [Clostridium sp.]|nr:BMP family ABC transporter substrate-binding protein [Clostridium sp.]
MLKKVRNLLLVGALAIGTVGCSSTKTTEKKDDFKVCLVLDEGGVNDQSFNESAWKGALEAKEEYGIEVSYIESKGEGEYLQNVETAIDQDNDLVVGVGFKLTDTIGEAAKAYPEQKFALIDGTFEEIPKNVQPILFNEEQAGYATGLIASQMTKSNVVGFVGGMDIPSCSQFLVGFEKAIKAENSSINVLSQYANSFTDAAKGKTIAQQMINNGADILFMAGGGCNAGVIEAAKENNIKVIGVDLPSNYLAPETIITSALKNIGQGLKLTIKETLDGNFNGGNEVRYDLSNGGVGYEVTDHLSDELIKYVDEKLKAQK